MQADDLVKYFKGILDVRANAAARSIVIGYDAGVIAPDFWDRLVDGKMDASLTNSVREQLESLLRPGIVKQCPPSKSSPAGALLMSASGIRAPKQQQMSSRNCSELPRAACRLKAVLQIARINRIRPNRKNPSLQALTCVLQEIFLHTF